MDELSQIMIVTFMALSLVTVLSHQQQSMADITNITEDVYQSLKFTSNNSGRPPFYGAYVKSGFYASINQNMLNKTFALQINMHRKPDNIILIANSTNQLKVQTEVSCFSIYVGEYDAPHPNTDILLTGDFYHYAFQKDDEDTKITITQINSDTIYIIKYFRPNDFVKDGCKQNNSILELLAIFAYQMPKDDVQECPQSHSMKISMPGKSGNFCIDFYKDHNVYDKLKAMNADIYGVLDAPQDNKTLGNVRIGIGVSVPLLGIGIVVIVLCLVKRRRQNNRNSGKTNKNVKLEDNAEDQELIYQSGEVIIDQQSDERRAAVVASFGTTGRKNKNRLALKSADKILYRFEATTNDDWQQLVNKTDGAVIKSDVVNVPLFGRLGDNLKVRIELMRISHVLDNDLRCLVRLFVMSGTFNDEIKLKVTLKQQLFSDKSTFILIDNQIFTIKKENDFAEPQNIEVSFKENGSIRSQFPHLKVEISKHTE